MKSFLALMLFLTLAISPVRALTAEAVPTVEVKTTNYWTEFDITFWQTMPWAAFWGCVIDRNVVNAWLPSGQPHWDAILVAATVISIVNANWHASTVMDNVRERNSKQINFWQRR